MLLCELTRPGVFSLCLPVNCLCFFVWICEYSDLPPSPFSGPDAFMIRFLGPDVVMADTVYKGAFPPLLSHLTTNKHVRTFAHTHPCIHSLTHSFTHAFIHFFTLSTPHHTKAHAYAHLRPHAPAPLPSPTQPSVQPIFHFHFPGACVYEAYFELFSPEAYSVRADLMYTDYVMVDEVNYHTVCPLPPAV